MVVSWYTLLIHVVSRSIMVDVVYAMVQRRFDVVYATVYFIEVSKDLSEHLQGNMVLG